MKIALPVVNNEICAHFGHCESFCIYDVDPGSRKILKSSTLKNPPHEPGLLPRLLSEKGINVVIAGGMGARAQELFAQKDIKVVVGVDSAAGNPEDIVQHYLEGSLQTGVNACDH